LRAKGLDRRSHRFWAKIEISCEGWGKKAWTARAFDISTKELSELSQSGDQFFGIHASNNGRVMIFAGGIPLKRGNDVVGAVGVSGGMGKQDQAVAEAGADAF
jgi:uncharacterized protein GlcG (DUF336 family)